jgi:hypothetical protein
VPRKQAHDRNCLNLEAKGVLVHIPAEPNKPYGQLYD